MSEDVGGYRCPHCPFRAVVSVLVTDHIRQAHQEETRR